MDGAARWAPSRLSQGQTVWRITARKQLKRSLYGRAGFALFKQRMLYAQAAAYALGRHALPATLCLVHQMLARATKLGQVQETWTLRADL
jgi:hypothetical protein